MNSTKIKLDISSVESCEPKLLTVLKKITEHLLHFSMNYSFAGKQNGKINIQINSTKPGELIFTYLDNGDGIEYDDLKFFYENDVETEKPFTYYFRLIQARIKSLKPKIIVDSEFGEFFEITFIFKNK